MALLKIGIIENVSFSKATGFDAEGNRVIVLQVKPTDQELTQALLAGKVLEPAQSNMRIFDPNMKTFKGAPKTAVELIGDYMKFQQMLLTYGKLLATEEEVMNAFGGAKPFIRLGIPEDQLGNIVNRFADEAFLKKVYDSAFTLFAEFLQTIDNLEEIKFRHKFWRASANKAFASIPSAAGEPYVESMQVPIENSAIGWSVWELENKKNSDAEVAADKPKDTAPVEAEDMFGAPSAPAPSQPDLLDVKG